MLGNGGTTCFWDAATFGLIEDQSQHLSFGEFSSKFAACATAAPHLKDPQIIASEVGTHPLPVADCSVDLYALTHNETSTGVAMPIRRPKGAALPQDGGGLVAVDGTSGAGGLRVDPTEFDAYYLAPQKCFASDGGLWIALMSPAALERVERIAAIGPLDPHLPRPEDGRRQLQARPDLQHAGAGHHLHAGRATRLDERQRRPGVDGLALRPLGGDPLHLGRAVRLRPPFVENPQQRSHVVGTIDFVDAVDAAAVAAVLRANGIVDTEPYRKLGRNQLRIAMFPAIEPDDVASLCACINYVVGALASA